MARPTRKMLENKRLRQKRKIQLQAEREAAKNQTQEEFVAPYGKDSDSGVDPDVQKIKISELHKGRGPELTGVSAEEVASESGSALDNESRATLQTHITAGVDQACDIDCDTNRQGFVLDAGGLRCSVCKSRKVRPSDSPDYWQCGHCGAVLIPRQYDPDERIAGYESYGPHTWTL